MTADALASFARATVCAQEALDALRDLGLDVPSSPADLDVPSSPADLDDADARVREAVAGAVTDADCEEEAARVTAHGDDVAQLKLRGELLRATYAYWRAVVASMRATHTMLRLRARLLLAVHAYWRAARKVLRRHARREELAALGVDVGGERRS